MNQLIRLLFGCLLMTIAGCAKTQTVQYRERTSDGTLVSTYSKGPNGEMVAEEWDSQKEYEDCMANVNRRQLNGMTADMYCSQKTRSARRKLSDARTGFSAGAFALNGVGYQNGSWGQGPGVGQSGPPFQQGGPHYTGADPNNAQFATATPVYANGTGNTEADHTLVSQVIQNSNDIAALKRGNPRSGPVRSQTKPPQVPAHVLPPSDNAPTEASL